MQIVVVGAGQVGSGVAKGLDEQHEIVVIDHDPDKLDRLRYAADVMTYEGNGADIDVLEEAGTSDADMIIASTDDDRTNILVCGTARALNEEIFNVARVAETGYLKAWRHSHQAFNVDLMVGSDHLAARKIVGVGLQQSAQDVEYFGEGEVEMAEFNVSPESSLVGRAVKDLKVHGGLRLAAVFDDQGLEVVRGDTTIEEGDRLLVIGRADAVAEFGDELGDEETDVSRVFILGGGEIAYQTAQLMQRHGIKPKIVEWDRERAEFLAKNLADSFVLHNDATDPEFLQEEGLSRAHLVVSALRPDERNLMCSQLAQHLGAEQIISVVHDSKYTSMFESCGIPTTVNPRKEVIEEILRHTRARYFEKIEFVAEHRGEVVELELGAESPLLGGPLSETASDLPGAMVIGAVYREGETLIPTGDTELQAGDDLVIFVASDTVDELIERI
jgi:trk system potassium uptake protein TrkA